MTGSTEYLWITELIGENFLAVLDVALDIEKELQLTDDIVIPLLQYIVKFHQLFPGDAINIRDRYCELRWKATQLLKNKGAIEEIVPLQGFHRWETRLRIRLDSTHFAEVLAKLKEEYASRQAKQQSIQNAQVARVGSQYPTEKLQSLILRFHSVVIQLRQRHDNRQTLDVSDEYDVQDLLQALLRLFFDDVRPEEWTSSYAGKASRVDFLLKLEQMVVEIKKTRAGLGAKEIRDQLIIDIASYAKMSDCKTLVCMVYDPENRITNPGGFQSDLSVEKDGLKVEVIVVPKQY
jgi:hypothetical protein